MEVHSVDVVSKYPVDDQQFGRHRCSSSRSVARSTSAARSGGHMAARAWANVVTYPGDGILRGIGSTAIQLPAGKDVTAFWQAGGRVRDWMRFDMARRSGGARVIGQ